MQNKQEFSPCCESPLPNNLVMSKNQNKQLIMGFFTHLYINAKQ